MWRLYLEVAILVVIAFGLGALVAHLVLRRVVQPATPDDPETTPSVQPAGTGTGSGAGTGSGSSS